MAQDLLSEQAQLSLKCSFRDLHPQITSCPQEAGCCHRREGLGQSSARGTRHSARHSRAMNRGSIFDRYFKLLLGFLYFFSPSIFLREASLAAAPPRFKPGALSLPVQSCSPRLPCARALRAQAATLAGKMAGIRREMLAPRRSHGNVLLQSRRHICQGSEICHLIARISMLWMRSHHTKSRSGSMP